MTELNHSPLVFVTVFFLGLGLNLTPCVYPMLSITASLFRGSSGESHGHAFWKALAYVLGMVTMYSGLGFAAAMTGSFFGELLQNFWVQLGAGIFVLALACSMLGLYQFRLPAGLMPSGGWASKHTLFSFYVSGLLVGIIAAPCMGPAVLALLTFVSTQQNGVLGFFLFFVMALGLGLPYLVLGTYSGLLSKLPRSGAWLVWFERLMGAILFFFGILYITVAFRWPFLKWLVPSALVGGGIYLGWVERSAKGSKFFPVIQKILGTLAILLGLSLFLAPAKNGVVWENYRAGILEEAMRAGQPAVLDFFADWCIPCHELDHTTYTDRDVVRALEPLRRIKVDVTSVDTPVIEEVTRRFDVQGVPTVLFLDGRGKEIPGSRLNGFIPPKEFLAALRASGVGDASEKGA